MPGIFVIKLTPMETPLTTKYNVPGPRYTSYPTVPYWDDDQFSLRQWKETLLKIHQEDHAKEGISLYIHLPFCESLCTFCGCTKRITKNHQVEIPYLKAVLKELELYSKILGEKPRVRELHLGGGTPTFFSSENLQMLLEGVFRRAYKSADIAMSFEGHPNNTTETHLKILSDLGFTRVSFGVQDYNEKVQRAIHRIQPFEKVRLSTALARKYKFRSVGHDLIYGLPFQTQSDIRDSINKTLELRPDRIAFYSYAHVPWIKGNGQRGFKEENLPDAAEKRAQYELGKQLLLNGGYLEIGMDHFALPGDPLYQALKQGRIHRNFMGYTDLHTPLLIGLGASAIGDSWYGFAQNVKGVEAYQDLLKHEILPVKRGHILTEEDLMIRKHILSLMCTFKTDWKNMDTALKSSISDRLMEMEKDGLVCIEEHMITITEAGRPFVRNVCMAFDLRLQKSSPETQLFSMTI